MPITSPPRRCRMTVHATTRAAAVRGLLSWRPRMAPFARLLGLAAMDAAPPATPPKPRRPRGRPPIHLSASLNLVLPSQLFPEFPPEGRVPGERRLMLAVLE